MDCVRLFLLPRQPIDVRHLRQRKLQCLRAVAGVTVGDQREIQLLGQRQPRQAKAQSPRFGQRDAHVLDEMLDEEAGGEIVRR